MAESYGFNFDNNGDLSETYTFADEEGRTELAAAKTELEGEISALNETLTELQSTARAGFSGRANDNVWFKICSCSTKGLTSSDNIIIKFIVINALQTSSRFRTGILTAHVRVDSGTPAQSQAFLYWDYVDNQVDLNDFQLIISQDDDGSWLVELYAAVRINYTVFHFYPLFMSNLETAQRLWTLYDSYDSGIATLPEGYLTVASTLLTLANPTTN